MNIIRKTLIGLYVFLVLFITLPYTLIFSMEYDNYYFTYGIMIALAAVVLWNIVNLISNVKSAIIIYKAGENELLQSNMRKLKYGLIPYFIINFLEFTFLLTLSAAMLGPGLLLMIMFIVFCTYLVTLSASSYGIALVISLKKSGYISKVNMIVHIILQACFVLDVMDSI